MTHIKAYLLCWVLLCVIGTTYAQQHMESTKVWLKNGQKTLPEIYDFHYQSSELIQGKYYRFIQFYSTPTYQDLENIKAAKVELLEYIPDNAFIAAIPLDFDQNILPNLNIRAVTKISKEDKSTVNLHLNDQSQKDFILQFHKNITKDWIYCFLKDQNIEITGSIQQNNALQISSSMILLQRLANHPAVLLIEAAQVRVEPEDNRGNAQHRTNTLATNFPTGNHYDGMDVNIAIGDDGFVGPHIDFQGRIFENDNSQATSGIHGDMVAGILAGAGNLDPKIKGVACASNLFIYNDFEAVEKAVQLHQSNDIVITSTSYGDGCNRGYTTFTQLADLQIVENPSLIHVFSAGNAGNQDCEYGAGPGWGNITGGVKVGKNVLAVGNLDSDDQLVFNSSRGPSNDGRIKPDLCANGEGHLSTSADNTYQTSSGSSAAAPVVSGILAQLYEAYRNFNNGQNPESALLKAILINTADDLGNPGPDYSYGWGKANALKAVNALESGNYFSGALVQDQTLSFDLNVPEGVQQLKVMLYWNDKEGSTVSSKSLVNDLDLNIQKDNAHYLPWVLNSSPDPALLNQHASTGTDHLNNMEQVVIENPESGVHQLNINSYSVPLGPQKFYVVYEYTRDDITLTYPFGNEKLNKGDDIRIHWDAGQNSGNFDIHFSQNNGQTWVPITTVNGAARFYDWTLPDVITSGALIRVSRNGISSINQIPFHIFIQPEGLEISEVCPEQVTLSWQAIDGADHYIIHQLKSRTMDSIALSFETNIVLPIDSPEEMHWFAITAIHSNGTQSQRSIAVNDGTNLLNCVLQHDLRLVNIAQPNTTSIQNCFDQNTIVAVNIKNEGTLTQSGFQLYLQLNNEPPIVEDYPGTIPPEVTVNYNFQSGISLEQAGIHQLKVWLSQDLDQASYNDSLEFIINSIPSSIVQLPYFQNFDAFEICEPANHCDNPCSMQEGWKNDSNEYGDQLDWRPYRGSTPTVGTGPQKDQNANNHFGTYLYVEGSPGCFNSEAVLYSPCIDLTSGVEPVLSFWYHMQGADIGQLHIDLFDGNTWYNNLIAPISGDHGTEWQKASVNLATFSGNLVNIRIRAYTGNGFLTDIAIDNFSVLESAAAPIADFILEKYQACTDQSVQIFDNSYNEPLEWEWTIEPNTFEFIGGTSNNSPNPELTFTSTGAYSITLETSNNYGTNDVVKYDILIVSDGLEIPYVENFNTPIPSLDWQVENQDFSTSWEDITIIGKSGEQTNAVYVNNHSYNAIGEEDILTSKVIDLTNAQNPYLRFDLSYALFNQNYFDALRVELSSNCKESFDSVLFNEEGSALATADNQMTGWTPEASDDWGTEIIDLSDYAGQKIALRFINTCGFGNNLYLDNITVYEYEDFPNPEFNIDPDVAQFCVGELILFENNSEGLNLDAFEWQFGSSANPVSANTEGPHFVTYDEPGVYEISLRVFNAIGWEEIVKTIEVLEEPEANFTLDVVDATINCLNESSFASSYLWDFGDGTFSTEENPQHTYLDSDTYTVRLFTENHCGENMTEQIIGITSIIDQEKAFQYTIAPNPVSDFLHVNIQEPLNAFVELSIIEISGKTVLEKEINAYSSTINESVDTRSFAAGMYIVHIKMEDKSFSEKIIINR